MWTTSFRALTTDAEVVVEGDRLARCVARLCGTYGPVGGPVQHRYVVQDEPALALWRDGEILYRANAAIDLPPAFEMDLQRRAVAGAAGRLVLHAAALSIGGRAVVLVGPSGAGKSTLTTALIARGASYLSEECVAIDRDGDVYGLQRPIHVDVARPPPGFTEYDVPLRDRRLATREYRFFYPPAGALHDGPAPLSEIVSIQYRPQAPTRARTLSARELLEAMWPCIYRTDPCADPAGLRVAFALAARYPARRLESCCIDEACAALAIQ